MDCPTCGEAMALVARQPLRPLNAAASAPLRPAWRCGTPACAGLGPLPPEERSSARGC